MEIYLVVRKGGREAAMRVCTLGMVAVAARAAPAADAASGPIFTVMNTSETLPDGVWFRNSPHTADTSRIADLSVYKNEQVQRQCYAFGDAVGPYNNSLWYFMLSASHPVNYNDAANQGFLNAHYINNGKNANVAIDGVPACVNNRPPVSLSSAPTPTVTLAQGPAAPAGYRYAAANANGQVLTQSYCYSGDSPDHWNARHGVKI